MRRDLRPGSLRYLPMVAVWRSPRWILLVPLLWLRDMDSLEARPLPGTEGAWFPFWSPDGSFIGFQTPGQLKKIPVSGGPAQIVCDVRGRGGAAWSPSGVIVFAQRGEGLFQVPASGGIPTLLTTLESSRSETTHQWPQFLTDGRHFLYFAESLEDEHRGIYVASLDSEEPRFVLQTEVQATYAASGYLLFLQEATLMAQRFDDERLELTAEPFRIAEDVTANPSSNRASVSVSETGVMAFRTGGLGGMPMGQLVWHDREGRQIGTVGEPSPLRGLSLSRRGEGCRVEARFSNRNERYLVVDLEGRTETRLTFDPSDDTNPHWSPDGSQIAFASNRRGTFDLYTKAANGAGEAALLLESSDRIYPSGWSADGQFLLVSHDLAFSGGIDNNLSVLSITDDAQSSFLLDTEASLSGGRLSPDGRWLAYTANPFGGAEVYVQPFPRLEGRYLVSTDGGSEPLWRGDGKELFYLDSKNNLVAVAVETEPAFRVVASRTLFNPPRIFGFTNRYVTTRDGQRFLFLAWIPTEPFGPNIRVSAVASRMAS